MGIGTDTAKQLISSTTDRAELADAVNTLNEALAAHDRAEVEALKTFAETKAAEFEVVRAANVAEKLAELDAPKVGR